MSLPFIPEPDEQLARRFGAALFPRVDMDAVFAGHMPRPGLLRRHVFDFQDGMRMIASTDYDRTHCFVHMSFSSHPPITNKQEYEKFCAKVHARMKWITGNSDLAPVAREVTHMAIHLYFRQDDFARFIPGGGEQVLTE